MNSVPRLLIAAVFLLSTATLSDGGERRLSRRQQAGTGVAKTITHSNHERHYRIHVPASYDGSEPWPLVFVFHGGGSNADDASRMGFTPAADQRHFIAVYPEALRGHWNDGRVGKKIIEEAGDLDDIGFVLTLLKHLQREYKIDPARVFATGASNGGIMSHRVGMELSDHFHGIAPIIGGIAQALATKFEAKEPVSVLIIQGMDDPLVPYGGGSIITPKLFPGLTDNKRLPDRGKIVSTDAAVKLWLREDSITTKPTTKKLPDTDPGDGCQAEQITWDGGDKGSRVVLIKIAGAGHTIPGGKAYLPERIIGRVCRDFDGVGLIADFFGLPRQDKKTK